VSCAVFLIFCFSCSLTPPHTLLGVSFRFSGKYIFEQHTPKTTCRFYENLSFIIPRSQGGGKIGPSLSLSLSLSFLSIPLSLSLSLPPSLS